MDLSGIIFVALALAWAVYLIPQALKRHDEAARTRSVDRFSATMRVLARRSPLEERDAHDARVLVSPSQAHLRAQVRTPVPTRAAARAAARRRRRVLLVLLGATVLTAATIGGLRLAGIVGPWWSVAVPGGLVLAWLVVCRLQVRRLDRVRRPRYEGSLVTPDEEDTVQLDHEALRAAVAVEVDVTVQTQDDQQAAVHVEQPTATQPASTLWDPLPVTLPTYVSKPRAQRTVRTIDLTQPGVVSSGRSEDDSRLVAESTEAARTAAAQQDQAEQRRAAGG
ncbi:MAG: hypothetical protein Q8Q02_12680 [Nocardioides sp.]|nr:hypothetical protein [Nocardioides sp.]